MKTGYQWRWADGDVIDPDQQVSLIHFFSKHKITTCFVRNSKRFQELKDLESVL